MLQSLAAQCLQELSSTAKEKVSFHLTAIQEILCQEFAGSSATSTNIEQNLFRIIKFFVGFTGRNLLSSDVETLDPSPKKTPKRTKSLGSKSRQLALSAQSRLRPSIPIPPSGIQPFLLRLLSALASQAESGQPVDNIPTELSHLFTFQGAHLEYGRQLGKGAYGQVFEAVNRVDGRKAAVKRIPFRSRPSQL
ncbi:hypothetical protein CYMTET_31978 [Cymbomonas tetramitiformis]|uniref:Protein kinase domain-containing protein n=1 Tax=Cymbomonas tetramitiformis TaxID=36881 RepID=A0AAE0FG65_9CHLO|nr:hypothetical protein CYMTET_31978 [Cymbomonas tetramitiformis]